jgi:hypothetical protein
MRHSPDASPRHHLLIADHIERIIPYLVASAPPVDGSPLTRTKLRTCKRQLIILLACCSLRTGQPFEPSPFSLSRRSHQTMAAKDTVFSFY